MVKSKTKIQKQSKKKTNLYLVDTINTAKKNEKWLSVASSLTGTRKNKISINLGEVEKRSENSKIIVVPGKILSSGELTKKIKIVALGISSKAKEKILKSGGTFTTILEEIKLNPEGKGIKILK